jgi:hypothetical protein
MTSISSENTLYRVWYGKNKRLRYIWNIRKQRQLIDFTIRETGKDAYFLEIPSGRKGNI